MVVVTLEVYHCKFLFFSKFHRFIVAPFIIGLEPVSCSPHRTRTVNAINSYKITIQSIVLMPNELLVFFFNLNLNIAYNKRLIIGEATWATYPS